MSFLPPSLLSPSIAFWHIEWSLLFSFLPLSYPVNGIQSFGRAPPLPPHFHTISLLEPKLIVLVMEPVYKREKAANYSMEENMVLYNLYKQNYHSYHSKQENGELGNLNFILLKDR